MSTTLNSWTGKCGRIRSEERRFLPEVNNVEAAKGRHQRWMRYRELENAAAARVAVCQRSRGQRRRDGRHRHANPAPPRSTSRKSKSQSATRPRSRTLGHGSTTITKARDRARRLGRKPCNLAIARVLASVCGMEHGMACLLACLLVLARDGNGEDRP